MEVGFSTKELDPALEGLQPPAMWKLFDRMRKCPVAGGEEDQAPFIGDQEEPFMKLLIDMAAEHGCMDRRRDAAGNLCIHIPGANGGENSPPVAWQCHGDMICVKKGDKSPVFKPDTIQLKKAGSRLSAVNTTLGADDRAMIALGFSIAFDPNAVRPPLQIIITKSEETTTSGAKNLDPKALGITSNVLINLDNEAIDEVCVSSAGISVIESTKQIPRDSVESLGEGTFLEIGISNMTGGHSGEDIPKYRGNAILELNDILADLPGEVRLVSIDGGTKMNAIPTESNAVIFVPGGADSPLLSKVQEVVGDAQKKLLDNWPPVQVQDADGKLVMKAPKVTVLPKDIEEIRVGAMTQDVHRAVVAALAGVPNGVFEMAPDIRRDFPATSSNLGVIRTGGSVMRITSSVRSKSDASMQVLNERVIGVLDRQGFEARIAHSMSGWDGDPSSPLVQMLLSAYSEVTGGRKAKIKATHGGLETGILVDKLERASGKKVYAAAIGPTISNPHSEVESMDIDTVGVADRELRQFLRMVVEKPLPEVSLKA